MKHELLTRTEIINQLGLGDTFPTCKLIAICNVIRQEFGKCLGRDFLKFIEANIAKYNDSEEWTDREYEKGKVVIYCGNYYQAKEKTTAKPDDVRYWCLAPKFEKACLNEIWCDGSLANFLSWAVWMNIYPSTYIVTTDNGEMKNKSQYAESANIEEYRIKFSWIKKMYASSFEALHEWILDNANNTDCYNLYKGLNRDCCKDCGCKKQSCSCETNCVDGKKNSGGYTFC